MWEAWCGSENWTHISEKAKFTLNRWSAAPSPKSYLIKGGKLCVGGGGKWRTARKCILGPTLHTISLCKHLESLVWWWLLNWQSCLLHSLSPNRVGTKSTAFMANHSRLCLFISSWRIERETTFVLKMCSEHCTSHTLENNSSKKRSTDY